jgi:hypothetical protein
MHVCTGCGIKRDKPAPPRSPKGWKRHGQDVYCADCWRKSYILRAITIPISSPCDCDWNQLNSALREMWTATTQASNWMMTELYARDERRNGESKMPPMGRVYLYPETRARFPQLPSQTAAGLEKAVKGKYLAIRKQTIWSCTASLPTYRYPTPFPVPGQGWSVAIEEERLVVSVRIGDKRYSLRLRGGAKGRLAKSFSHQRRAVEQIICGEAIRGELALYRKGDDLMCKMVAWLPRDEHAQRQRAQHSGVLRVRTDTESLIIALNEKDERLWVYHADHLRRWVAEHRLMLERWSDDMKAEHRPVPPFAERRENAVRKQNHRMTSACHEVAAMIAGYAARRKFAEVHYDDSNHGFCEQFPWFRLRQLLAEKLDAVGIELKLASDEVVPKPNELLVGA